MSDTANPDGASEKNKDVSPYTIALVRAGVVILLALVTYVTISFCTQVYYDRESAFHEALQCTEDFFHQKGIEHWLQNGTLLGSTRLGRLVLWDADLDFGVLGGEQTPVTTAVWGELGQACYPGRSSVLDGVKNTQLKVWKKCTNRICADFHESVKQTTSNGSVIIVSGNGESPYDALFPLKACSVAGVTATCPNNAPYYLAQAYGSGWLTEPLAKLF